MSIGIITTAACVGIAVALIIIGRILDRFQLAYATTTTGMYLISSFLLAVGTAVLLYHWSGVEVIVRI